MRFKVSNETNRPVEWVSEENYKFALHKYGIFLKNWLEDGRKIYPEFRQNELKASLEGDLADLSLSRLSSKLQWAIPVPTNSRHVIYVWFDALFNYITAKHSLLQGKDCETIHVVGKDILK